jgi:hypothetical protein
MPAPSVNDRSRYPPLPDHLLANARLVGNRYEGLRFWPKNAVIAEVGVAQGKFTQHILDRCQPARFIAIDRFDLHQIPVLWGAPSSELFEGLTHEEYYRTRYAAEIAAGVMQVIQGDSAPAIESLPDQSVDLFYVDADHLYEGVRRDLEAIRTKVKPDGWIVMNDYIPADTFSNEPLGVIQATNEFMIANDWEMAYFALAKIMYCDVGLRKRGASADRRADLSAPLTAARQEIAALQAALAETRSSTSWRITAPLRAVSRRLRGRE